jgi:leucyl aminopeptidase
MKQIIKVEVSAAKAALEQCKTDILCVGQFADTKTVDRTLKQLDAKLDGALEQVIKLGDFKGEAGSIALIYTGGKIGAKRVLLVGLGDKKKATLDSLRRSAAAAAKKAVAMKAKRIAVALHRGINHGLEARATKFDLVRCGQVTAEGIYFGSYTYDEFMTSEKDGRSESLAVELIDDNGSAARKLGKGVQVGSVIGEAQNFARTLTNRPANVMYPERIAAEAKKMAAVLPGLSCTVFDDRQLRAKKMGGIMAVGQGSEHKPRMIVLKWSPKSAKKSGTVGLIGKAITFDSGGISIKPAANMEAMKMDKTGGAVVLGTMKAVAELKLPVKVTAVVCSAENLPGGQSYRPGDVIATYSGKTVEVLNTDAEGRMVLCDGIHYAKEQKCEPIIDIATLTGACRVALGSYKAGLMGNDERLIKEISAAAERGGEPVWHMPSGDEYAEELKSKIADLKNIGSKYGGACTAASFLGEFAGDTKWAHLDIAGPMEPSEALKKYVTEGSIGFGVRLFVEYLSNF